MRPSGVLSPFGSKAIVKPASLPFGAVTTSSSGVAIPPNFSGPVISMTDEEHAWQ